MPAKNSVAVGTLVAGRYRVENALGGGGMGEVYSAHDQRLDLRVALKVLKPRELLDAKSTARFFREARVAVHLESAYIARAHDFGICDEIQLPYIAFELLYGADLDNVLEREGRQPVERAVDYMLQALRGIAAAHIEGIAHRDLKPANLFRVEMDGRQPVIKVLDFGIAKALKGREIGRGPSTGAGEMFGTPLYMAPEQLRNSKRVDHRADIWSLGVILYELLAGAPPFEGATVGDVITAVMKHKVVALDSRRPTIPKPLSDVVHRCLERKREDRFASVHELALALAPFGSPKLAAEALEEIETLFRQRTEMRSSTRDLAMTDDEEALSVAATLKADRGAIPTPRPKIFERRGVRLGIVGLGLLVLLFSAAALGFWFARR